MSSKSLRGRARYEYLVASLSVEDRFTAASSPKCPPDLLVKLLQKAEKTMNLSARIIIAILKNPNLPEDVLAEKASYYIQHRRSTPASPQSWTFQIYLPVLSNPNLPAEACLAVYLHGRYPKILAHRNFPQTYATENIETLNSYEKNFLASNKNLTKTNQEKLFQLGNKNVHRLLARNSNLHPAVGRKLASSTSPPVLRALLRNRAVSEPIKKKAINTLLKSEAPRGVHTTAVLAQHTHDKEVYNTIVDEADFSHPVIAAGALANPLADSTVVQQICYSPNSKVREQAVSHPECTDEARIIASLL